MFIKFNSLNTTKPIMKNKTSLLIFLIITCLSSHIYAQNYFNDNGNSLWYDDDNLYDDSLFIDDDLGDDYISIEEQSNIDAKRAAQRERNQVKVYSSRDAGNLLKPNIAYGAITGLLIGGWIALNTQSSARDNFRYIGSGVFLGALMGLFVGSKPLRKRNVEISTYEQFPSKSLITQKGVEIHPQSYQLIQYSKQF